MEGNDVVKGIVELLSTGGNAALIFLVWFAFQVMQAGREAARNVKELRDAVVAQKPELERIAEAVEDVSKQNDVLDSRLARQDIQLTALMARHNLPG